MSLVAAECPVDKIHSIGNCSFDIECYDYVWGVRLPNRCLESSNDVVLIDVTLTGNVNKHTSQVDEVFLPRITTLKIHTTWPKTNLSILEHTTRLENLYLHNNGIEEIGRKRPFFILNSLEILDLSWNKLTDIEDLFTFELQPSKLRKLSLARNHIRYLSQEAFAELTSLVELDLSYNFISDLTMEPFANLTSLEVLKLTNNSIINLNGAVNNLQTLKHLYLRGNQIENIDTESLKIIKHLETFDVSLNNLEKIKPMLFLRHWTHLRNHQICKIILSENHIVSLPNAPSNDVTMTRNPRHVIRNVDVLTELDLSKNQISNIEFYAFQSLISLISLDLSKNKITDFVVNADDLMYVQYLNLSGNFITHLYFESFSRMNNLQNLDLSHNYLDYIPSQTFDRVHNLKHVNMTFNSIQILKRLNINMFHPEGGKLDLSNNGLSQLNIPRGEGIRLTDLILHSNNITDPALIDLRYHEDLKMLDLSSNHIWELHDNSLRLPISLTYLDLSSNRIQKIGPSAFLRISHLQTLHLSHNLLKTIEYGSFRGLSSLVNLDLAFNRITCLNSKFFMDLTSLSILSMRHNELSVIYDQAWYGHKINLKVYLDGNNFTCEWLGRAIKNYNNGYSKMHPVVLEGSNSGHSLDGIPCTPEQVENLEQETHMVMADERLLMTTQKILEAVREQTYFLKNYFWRTIQDDPEKMNTWRSIQDDREKFNYI